MKKIVLTVACVVMILGLTGCDKSNTEVSETELNKVNEQIIEYFSSENVYDIKTHITKDPYYLVVSSHC